MLINRNYARLWYGQAVSSVGDSVFSTTLVLWVGEVIAAGRPWAPAAVSGILVAGGAAYTLVGPVAGVLVDRWSRMAVMRRSEAARAVLAAGFAGLSFVPVRDLPAGAWLAVTYLVVFALTGAGQFFAPARLAAIAEVVEGEQDRARAAGISEATAAAAGIIGPPVAAPLLFAAGVHWALLADAASFAVSWAAVRSMRLAGPAPAPPGGAGRIGAEFRAGLRLLAGSRLLAPLLTVTVICQLGTGTVTALNVIFVTRVLHATPKLFGVAEMVMAAGAIAGALPAARFLRRFGARSLTCGALLALGALVIGYALQRAFVPGLALLAAYAAALAVLNTASVPLILGEVPREYLGRVTAVFSPVNHVASMTAMVAAGWVATAAPQGWHARAGAISVGPVSLVLAAGGCLILVAGIRACAALPKKHDNSNKRTAVSTRPLAGATTPAPTG